MFKRIRDFLCLDGIQDHELSPGSDWIWLTPEERLSVQSRPEAELAMRLIEKRKREAAAKDAVRVDAERYRLLRVDSAVSKRPVVWMCNESGEADAALFGEELDAAVDAALAQAKERA